MSIPTTTPHCPYLPSSGRKIRCTKWMLQGNAILYYSIQRCVMILGIVFFSVLCSCLYGSKVERPIESSTWKQDLLLASQTLGPEKHIIITLSNEWQERHHIINFILRMNHIGIKNYVILCSSYDVYNSIVGSWRTGFHGVLLIVPPADHSRAVDMIKMDPLPDEKKWISREKTRYKLEAVGFLLENNFRVTVSESCCVWVSRSTLRWIEQDHMSHIDIMALHRSSGSLQEIFQSSFYSIRPTHQSREAYMAYLHARSHHTPDTGTSTVHSPVAVSVPHVTLRVDLSRLYDNPPSPTGDVSPILVGVLPSTLFAKNEWCNVTAPVLYCFRPATLRLAKDASFFQVPRRWRKIRTPAEVLTGGDEISEWNEAGMVPEDYWKCMDLAAPLFVAQLELIASTHALRNGESKYIVITSSDWLYRGVLINWMSVMTQQLVSGYLVVCFGRRIHALTGGLPKEGGHGVLVTGWGTVNNMFIIRHHVAYALVKLGYTVSLVDSDAVWLKPFYHLWVAPYQGRVDIVAQMGRHPAALADRHGAAVCAGFLTIYPTTKAILFYEHFLALSKNGTNQLDDQKAINLALDDTRAFHFLERLTLAADRSSPAYGQVVIAAPADPLAVRLGFYPSAQFPRAEIDADKWPAYKAEHQPVVWHLLTKKTGNDKVYTMQYYQDVFVLDLKEHWRELSSWPQLKEYMNTNWTDTIDMSQRYGSRNFIFSASPKTN